MTALKLEVPETFELVIYVAPIFEVLATFKVVELIKGTVRVL
jgi:hypothetical protein